MASTEDQEQPSERVELSNIGLSLYNCSRELEKWDELDFRQLSIPALIHSDLRADAEEAASDTNVKFPSKLYYRLLETLFFKFFNPGKITDPPDKFEKGTSLMRESI